MNRDTTTRAPQRQSGTGQVGPGRVEPGQIGPARFQRVEAQAPPRRLAATLGSLLLLLVLVVGVPAGLVWLGGVPVVPRSLPDLSELTASVDAEQVLAVLVWVVWLAWLQFAVCVVVELRSALSGVGLPQRVPFAGPSQRLARTLVVSVLLLATAAGQASAAVTATGPQHGPASVSVSVSVLPGPGQGSTGQGGTGSGGTAAGSTSAHGAAASASGVDEAGLSEVSASETTSYWLGDVQLSAQEGAELVGRRVYVVQPPEGRYHDNLWDIAERNLGDGRRYREVFELNKGRDQPDGQELTLERLIHPNWLLVMPEDAAGVERVTAVVSAVTPDDAPAAPTSPSSVPVDAGAAETGAEAAGPAAVPTVHAQSEDSVGSAGALVGAGLLAAGLLVAVERLRRRSRTGEPSDDAVELEVSLRVGADPVRAALLDRALRGLAQAARSADRPLPGVFGALVGDDAVELRLSPPEPQAPAPWRPAADGSTWRIAAADLAGARPTGPAPFPGLVSLGRDAAGHDVLIDLEAAQGPVAILGDPRAATEVATALAAELATNRWSDSLQVTGVGLPDGLDALPAERYRGARSVADVLGRLSQRRADSLGSDVLSGRVRSTTAGAWVPEYLVLGEVPSADVAAQVVGLASTERRSPLGVVCVGDLPGARWQLVVTAQGRLTARLLGVDVQANRLDESQVAALAELLTAAPPADPVPAVDERRAAVAHEGAVGRPPVPDPPRPGLGAADLSAAPVRVLVLGEPRVEGAGVVEESRRELATELVVYLALHPEGVHANVLAAALWPGGVTAEVRESTLERTARWLGTDAAGRPRVVRDGDGRISLGADVVLDWDVVTALLARSRAAVDPRAERRDLTEALDLARGAVLGVRPAGRYSWLARVRLERASRALLVDAVHRLVVLCHDDDDPAAAQAAAWSGLRLAPTEELLWRDVLRAAAVLGGPAAVRQVAEDLEATLAAAGVRGASPQTRALVEDLAPSRSVPPARSVATSGGA